MCKKCYCTINSFLKCGYQPPLKSFTPLHRKRKFVDMGYKNIFQSKHKILYWWIHSFFHDTIDSYIPDCDSAFEKTYLCWLIFPFPCWIYSTSPIISGASLINNTVTKYVCLEVFVYSVAVFKKKSDRRWFMHVKNPPNCFHF